MKITGFVEAYLTNRKTGAKRKVFEGENQIDSDFYEALAKHFDTNYDITLDNLFVANENPPDNQGDGMVIEDSTLPAGGSMSWSMKTTLSQPAANQIRFTGLFDQGSAITAILPQLGINWFTTYEGIILNQEDFTDKISITPIFSQVVPSGEDLTIIWTITFTVH